MWRSTPKDIHNAIQPSLVGLAAALVVVLALSCGGGGSSRGLTLSIGPNSPSATRRLPGAVDVTASVLGSPAFAEVPAGVIGCVAIPWEELRVKLGPNSGVLSIITPGVIGAPVIQGCVTLP